MDARQSSVHVSRARSADVSRVSRASGWGRLARRAGWGPLLLALVAWGGPAAKGDDWPQFLGPNRTGISQETGLISAWPAEGLPELWRVAGGVGMSGVSVVGDRAVTLVQGDDRQWALCLAVATGKTLWKTELAPEYRNAMGDGPRGAPTIADGVAYVYTGEGVLLALNVSDGKVAWRKALVEELQGTVADYGMACSPLVVGDNVVVTVGAPSATVVAVSRKTGEIAWQAGKEFGAGYSSPAVRRVGGRDQLLVFHGGGAMGLDPASGGLLWSFPFETDFSCNIATPLAVSNGVLLSAGENHGSVLLDLKPRGKGFEPTPRWSSLGNKSTLRNEWQTSILLGDVLFGFDNVGNAGPVTHLTCVDAQSGERKWQQLRFGKGNLIAADGKLFCSTLTGELVVVAANPAEFQELGRMPVVGKTRQAPSLAGGRLFLRDDREIVCLDARAPAKSK